MVNVSVVVPIMNEVDSLRPLLERLEGVFKGDLRHLTYEVILVDDGSTDGTRELLAELLRQYTLARAIFFRRNFGKAAALAVGFREARGDVIVTIDGDLQDPPEEIPLMLNKLNEGYDLVSGWKKVRKDPFEKRFFSKIFNWIVSRSLGVYLHDFNCGFKAYRSWCVKCVTLSGSLYRFLPVFVAKQGGKVTEIPISHNKREFGKSKYGFGRYLQGFFDLITMLFLTKFFFKPMHFFGLVALPIVALGSVLCLYLLGGHLYWLISGDITYQLVNRPLLLLSLAMLGFGLTFILIGALAEFLLQLNGANNPSLRFYSVEKVIENGKERPLTP